MTNVLETKIEPENQAADGRFFISTLRVNSLFLKSLIEDLPVIEMRSRLAQEELRDVITEEEHKEYVKKIGELAAGRGDEDTLQLVGYMQGISDEAGYYQDAVAAIRGAGEKLADHLRTNLPNVSQRINENFYWVVDDCTGNRQFCGATDDGEEVVVFGTLAFPDREEGREAKLEDYIRLINDVEAAAA